MTTITGVGDCYPTAFHFVYDRPEEDRDEYRICHGTATGQGPIAGVRFGHAWVERVSPNRTTVIDRSNGNNVAMPSDRYYRVGRIDPDEVRRYSWHEAALWALTTEHYGPWEEDEEAAA